ncbi:MAG: recombination protein RecR [Spirochaetales bacterium]|nr:recombination protein RecR [Spirochaetales bacterium]
MTVLERLIQNLSRLPGLGRKSATRIAYFLLNADDAFNKNLAGQIEGLKSSIRRCRVCGNYTETEICGICSNPSRDHSLICAVEQPQDILTIEATHEYDGIFHVLGGVISPIDGVRPEDLNIQELVRRVGQGDIKEVILATNPTVEGDTTALYLAKLLSSSGVTVTRLATGIPAGGDLEYADRTTLARSLRGRTPLSY